MIISAVPLDDVIPCIEGAARTKVLFNVSGSQSAPVVGLTIRGIEIRDTALTYYGTDEASKHSMPTGGDWVGGSSSVFRLLSFS